MRTPLKVAIAGLGFIGQVHVRAARAAGAQIVGVSGGSPEKTRATADSLNIDRVYSSSEELVSDPEVDVVHICTPNNTHTSLSLLALQNNKNIVCEKPLATTVEDAAQLVALAHDCNLVAAVPFVYRFHPMALEAKHRAATELGNLRLAHGSYQQDWLASPNDYSWRVNPQVGGASQAFADIGSHWCDLVEFVTGYKIFRLCAKMHTTVTTRKVNNDAAFSQSNASQSNASQVAVTGDDAITMMFEARNATTGHVASGTLLVSQVSWGRKNRLWFELDGENESIVFNQEDAEHLWLGGRNANAILSRDPSALSAQAARYATLPAGHAQGYEQCFNAFINDVYNTVRSRKNDERPSADDRVFATFDDGLRAAQITQTVLESSKTETWKEVPQ